MRADKVGPVALVVEDEALLRLTIVDSLIDSGWVVVEAATGQAAIELFASIHVDALFTDIQLLGSMSGWDVADALRKMRSDLPVIYTSANVTDHSRKVSGALFFGKPYDSGEIVTACNKFKDGGAHETTSLLSQDATRYRF